jgi:DNA polymerase III subunit gamma/tau
MGMTKLSGSTFFSISSMSYLPFHHKYRPQTFADLVGQEAIATTLTNALRSQKIAPAYLLTGPRGTGKTSSARIFAKSLNCMASEVPTAQPCGKCPTCQSITLGNALDVVEIDAASNTGVDNIREIIDRAQYAPVQCRYKVYLIDECHMLSTAAFNSLLKTLEEPPPHVVFILATTDPQRVLPTIISRCQKFDYRRIPLADMVKHLTYIADLEKMNITAGALQLVAQIAQGGLRDAESLLDQLSLMSTEVTVDRVWELVGAVPEKDLLAMATAIHQHQLETLLDHCRQLVERGKEPLMILQNLAGFYRDLSIAQAIPHRPDLTNITAESWPAVCQLASQMELATILTSQQQLKDSENQVKGNTQPRLWLEITLLGLHRSSTIPPEPSPLPTIVPANLNAAPIVDAHRSPLATSAPIEPVAISPPAIIEPELAPEPTPSEPEIPEIDLAEVWQQVLGQLLPSGKGLFAPHGQLLAVVGEVATVGMKSSTLMKLAEGQKQHLQKALTAILSHPITVILKLSEGDSAQKMAATTPAPTSSPVTAVAPPPAAVIAAKPIAVTMPDFDEVLEEPAEYLDAPEPEEEVAEPAQRELGSAAVAPSIDQPIVQEQPTPFTTAETPTPLTTNGHGNGHSTPTTVAALPQILVENTITPFTDLDLDAAAARIAEQFGGEIVEEYVTIWDL